LIVIVVIAVLLFLNDFGEKMGGVGSGNWHRPNRKTTVERCLSISVSDFLQNIYNCVSGELKWSNRFTGKETSSIGFQQLPENGSESMLILSYECDGHAVHEPISFQKTKPHFGGNRWWFTCPLCQRRMGVFYLPPKSYYFACRKCYDLRYKSSQEAGHLTNFIKLLLR
jgi:hypothetical protein